MTETASSFTNLLLSKARDTASDNISLPDFVSLPEVAAGFCEELGMLDLQQREQFVIRLAIALAREALPIWVKAHPLLTGPVDALTQAEKWMDSPCDEFAEIASDTQSAAVHDSLSVWRQEPKSAGWAGRTAAWVADAPKYGWQAVAAIMGAQQALGIDDALSSAIQFHETEKQRAQQGGAGQPATRPESK
jgi:hypothetical protein